MRLIGAAFVANESDSVESFVRHNLQFLDRLHLIGTSVVDNTLAIVRRLQDEGLPVELLVDPVYDRKWNLHLTRQVRRIAARERFDFVAVLDGDEFILAASRAALEQELAAVPRDCCLLLPWTTYVPTVGDDWAEPAILRRIRHRRISEPPPGHCKVVVPFSICADPNFNISLGNHYAMLPDMSLFGSQVATRAKLAHLPVRSPRQLLSKALLGEWTLRRILGRGPHVGTHWAGLARRMVESLEITPAELEQIALNYAGDSTEGIVLDPIPNLSNYRLAYTDLIDDDPFRRVVRFADAHFERLAQVPLQTETVMIANTLGGVIAHAIDEQPVSLSLEHYGEWAGEDQALLAAVVGPGDCVLDAGAGIGVHAVSLARLVGAAGTVHAVEPRPDDFRLLCANAALNGLPQLKVHDGGLGFGGSGEAGLADVLANLGPERLPGLKLIRFEGRSGGEAVMDALANLIARDRPWLFIENADGDGNAALIGRLFNIDYRAWWQAVPYFNPANYYRQDADIFAKLGHPKVNILAGPRRTAMAFEGLTEITDTRARWQDAPVLHHQPP